MFYVGRVLYRWGMDSYIYDSETGADWENTRPCPQHLKRLPISARTGETQSEPLKFFGSQRWSLFYCFCEAEATLVKFRKLAQL